MATLHTVSSRHAFGGTLPPRRYSTAPPKELMLTLVFVSFHDKSSNFRQTGCFTILENFNFRMWVPTSLKISEQLLKKMLCPYFSRGDHVSNMVGGVFNSRRHVRKPEYLKKQNKKRTVELES